MAKNAEWQIVEDSPVTNMQIWYSEKKRLFWIRSRAETLPHISIGMVPDFMVAIRRLGEYELTYGAAR